MTDFSIAFILPQLSLIIFGVLALLVGLFSAKDGWLLHSATPALMALIGLIIALESQIVLLFKILPGLQPLTVTQLTNALTIDAAGVIFGLFACAGTLICVLISMDHFQGDVRHQGEYYFFLLFACAAATLVAYAGDFISIYLSIEFLSIASYILAGFAKGDVRSNEAAIKYLLFGGACSAVMLYGMSLIYGITGTINLAEMAEVLTLSAYFSPALWVAVFFVIVGIGFKLAVVPFHLWAPDVYEGSPTPVTAFLSVVSKVAGLAILLRFLWTPVSVILDWVPLIVVLSALTMTLGNLAAIPQRNIKRMLAYSSISHAGFLLIGIAALGVNLIDPTRMAVQGIYIYVLGYLFANLGAFAAVIAVSRDTGSDDVEAYRGLMRRSPLLAISLVVFFLSLAGVPPTLGFAGKFWLFAAAIKTDYTLLWALAAVGVANSVISVYYYFNVARVMFFNDATGEQHFQIHPATRTAVWVCAVASIVLLLALQPIADIASANAWMSFTLQ